MPYENLYVGIVLLSGAFAVVIAAWLWSDDPDLDTKLFTAMLLLHPLVAALVSIELLAPSRDVAIAFYGVHEAAVAGITTFWFLFAVVYTDRRGWLTGPLVGLVLAWWVVIGTLEITNPLHHLVWSSYEVAGSTIPHVQGAPTVLYLVLVNGSPVFYFAGMGLILLRFLRSSGTSRLQTLALLVGFLPPLVAIATWSLGVLPGPLNGAFVVGSSWSFLLVTWAIYRYQLFDVVPLARETVFGELGDPVIVVDDDLRLLDYNRSAAATFPELVGRHGETLEERLPAVLAVDGEGRFAESFVHYSDRGPRDHDVSASTLSSGGDVRGYALVLGDVTERRQHLRDLEQQTEQLERFASTLSHDLRNPLNVAQARVRMAIESDSTENLGKATEALDRIEAMIQDLLTLAREGQTIDEVAPTRLRGVLQDAWATTDTGGATLAVEADADVVVFADRDRLQNVFENLVRNAVTHGGPDVTVTLGRHPDGFYVEDDGRGVPPEERDDVFEFGHTTAAGGTGLGLAIVESVARAHGWNVEMTEGSDGGARVVFSDVDVIEGTEGPREPAHSAA